MTINLVLQAQYHNLFYDSMTNTNTSCKFCKNDLLIEVGKIVECPNGCIPCDWCGNLLWDNAMEEHGESDGAIDGMHIDCAGEYQQIRRQEDAGDREYAEQQEMYEGMD